MGAKLEAFLVEKCHFINTASVMYMTNKSAECVWYSDRLAKAISAEKVKYDTGLTKLWEQMIVHNQAAPEVFGEKNLCGLHERA